MADADYEEHAHSHPTHSTLHCNLSCERWPLLYSADTSTYAAGVKSGPQQKLLVTMDRSGDREQRYEESLDM